MATLKSQWSAGAGNDATINPLTLIGYINTGNTLQIVDFSAAAASDISSYDYGSTSGAIKYSNNKVFGVNRLMDIINVTNPSAPAILYRTPSPYYVYQIQVEGNIGYFGFSNGTIRAYDLTTYTQIGTSGMVESSYWGFKVDGDYLYVTAWSSGLRIYSWPDKSVAPTLISTTVIGDRLCGEILVSGNRIYVQDYYAGFHVIDVTNKSAPVLVGSYIEDHMNPMAGSWGRIGASIFMTSGVSGVVEIDVGTDTPSLVEILPIWGGVNVSENFLIVSNDSTVNVYEIIPSAVPATINVSTTPVNGGILVDGVNKGTAPLTLSAQPGTYVISFADVSGYTTPAAQTITVIEAQTINVSATYVAIPPGSIHVTTTPINGPILIDGVASGTAPITVSAGVGSYVISFGSVSGYTSPVAQTITVSSAQTTNVSGTYVAIPSPGTLIISTSPAGGEVFVDGVSKGSSPQTISISAGSHVVSFGALSGYTAPANQTVTVVVGGTTTVTGTYVVVPVGDNAVMISEWPYGNVEGVATYGTNLYLNMGDVIQAFSVGAGTANLTFEIKGVGVPVEGGPQIGQYIAANATAVAVAMLDRGLAIIDLASRTYNIYSFSRPVNSVALSDNYCYVSAGGTLVILDVSSPTQARVVNDTSLPCDSTTYADNYLYCAASAGYTIYNVSSPTSVTTAYHAGTSAQVFDIAVFGNYAYVVNGYNSVDIWDVTSKTAPVMRSQYVSPAGDVYHKVAALSDNLIVVSNHDNYVELVNVSSKTSPQQSGIYDYRSISGGYPRDLARLDATRFVLGLNYQGADIVNYSTPTAPTQNIHIDGMARTFAVCFNPATKIAYALDDAGLGIYDCSTAYATQLSYVYFASRGWNIRRSGNTLFCATTWGGMKIVDVSNPRSPTILWDWNPADYVWGVEIDGNVMVIDFVDASMGAYDITNLSNPVELNRFWIGDFTSNTTGWINSFGVSGGYLYITDENGLHIYDWTNKNAPPIHRSVIKSDMEAPVGPVLISGNRAYVQDFARGFYIFDVTNKTAPTLAGKYLQADVANNPDPDGMPWGISGNRVVIGTEPVGLTVVDVSNPANPVKITDINSYANSDYIDVYVSSWLRYNAGFFIWSFQSAAGTGTLTVETTPITGTVFVDGVSRGSAPQTLTLTAGSHVVSFGAASGYNTPQNQTVDIVAGLTTIVSGMYTISSPTQGTLSVTTSPISGQVLVNGTAIGMSPVSALYNPGTYTVSFGSVAGYTTPPNQTVVVAISQDTPVVGTYVPIAVHATINVTTTPVSGAIYVGGTLIGSGSASVQVDAGTYTVSFGAVSGYDKPADFSFYVGAGETVNIPRAAYPLETTYWLIPPAQATLNLSTAPVAGTIFVNGSLAGNGSVSVQVDAGSYTVSFGSVSGYTTPADQTVTASAGGTYSFIGTYVLIPVVRPTLNVSTTPVSGGIYVNGALAGTGSISTQLDPGTYTISFGNVSGYTTPGGTSLILAAGQTYTIIGTYVQTPIEKATLNVSTSPLMASIYVNAVYVGDGSASLQVDPGNYDIDFADVVGYVTPASRNITVSGGSTYGVVGTYVPVVVANGTLVVNTSPVLGTAYLDGVSKGPAPVNLSLAPGTYELSFGAVSGYITPESRSVVILSGQSLIINVVYAESPKSALPAWVVPSVVGVGVLGIILTKK